MYIQRGEEAKDETGFLALDPRISLVRHEALGISGDLDATPRTRRVVAAMACPEELGYDPLDLGQEQANLEQALSGLSNLELATVLDATIQAVSDALAEGADIFHFAGHGWFTVTERGESFRSIEGEGELAFVTAEGTAARISAAKLAVNMQGRGVQLALLGACQTGRRDGQNVWSGTVAALMEAGIPAAVAMQYKIWDDAAIAFSKKFYQALATGAPIDAAVSAGRIAAFNLCHPLREDPKRGRFWRDWGVPVLYLRSEQDFVLPAVEDEREREAIAGQLRIDVDHRIDLIGSKGKYKAVEAGVMDAGSITAYLEAKVIRGSATQVDVEDLTGGAIEARAAVELVEGSLIGVKVGHLGRRSTAIEPKPQRKLEEDQATCPNPECGRGIEPEWARCPFCGANLGN
jgi:pimeloyl-ACP methyl ester carboxylesterase